MWQISSKDGRRSVRFDSDHPDGISTAPPELLCDVVGVGPVEIAPMTGDWYTPTGPADPVAVFLRARAVLGGSPVVRGVPPRLPAVTGGPPPQGFVV